MKYRGVEVQEICIGVEYDDKNLVMSKLRDNLLTEFTFESVSDNYGIIRCGFYLDTSDEYALLWLESVYNCSNEVDGLIPYVDILTEDWWAVDGNEYNNDSVDWDTFISRLERD